MYSVKPNGNYNIVINDIGVAINSTSSVSVEKSKIDNSGDAQRLLEAKLIVVEEANGNKTVATQLQVETKTENVKIFVAGEEVAKVNNGVFVREPEKVDIAAPIVEEAKATEVAEVPTEEVKVETVEAAPVVENTEVVAEVKTEEATEVIQKSVTKKGRK